LVAAAGKAEELGEVVMLVATSDPKPVVRQKGSL
jgi:hypothetical protein